MPHMPEQNWTNTFYIWKTLKNYNRPLLHNFISITEISRNDFKHLFFPRVFNCFISQLPLSYSGLTLLPYFPLFLFSYACSLNGVVYGPYTCFETCSFISPKMVSGTHLCGTWNAGLPLHILSESLSTPKKRSTRSFNWRLFSLARNDNRWIRMADDNPT